MSVEAFLGEVRMFGGTFAPRGWAFCNGQLLAISSHDALFSILGTIYGGDGRSSFALPDLRSRVPVHSGDGNAGPGLSAYRLGQRGGREDVTLTTNQMPRHAHQIQPGGGSAGGTADLKVFEGNGDTSTSSSATSMASQGSAGPLSLSLLSQQATNSVVKNAVVNIKGGGVPSTTEAAGGVQPVDNVQPYLGINFIISLEGVFPPRS